MTMHPLLRRHLRVQHQFASQFASIVVGLHGLFILATTLLDQIAVHRGNHISDAIVDIPLLIGISLVYLSTLLHRKKRTAWLVTVIAYAAYLGLGIGAIAGGFGVHHMALLQVTRAIILPATILGLLFAVEKQFVVQSDIQGFRGAARFSVVILLVALVYGVAGFSLLDRSDFHQEISLPSAIHYTIDQFDLTTNRPVHPYTKRASLFTDSLSFVSLSAFIYAAVSLFQPLRARLSDQSANRDKLHALLRDYGAPSEDFFKLWPHDKQYFFDDSERAGVAFRVHRGVALCLGDPAGDSKRFSHLLTSFQDLCYGNDWLPAFIHVQDGQRKLYEKHDYALQKIGQEAVVDIAQFTAETANNKYFRQIRNKFTKQGFTCELLQPPHHSAVVDRLKVISDEWLQAGGRVERGFAMGYFTPEYMQLCPIMVARDAAGTIQAFINQLPADFDPHEATFDLLRHTHKSLGNSNDFLLMNFIATLGAAGYTKLNLGLCPLTGLDDSSEDKSLIDSVLRFAYANGDRFYSFSGLYRFKVKYQPEWRDRYIAYQSGLRGFSRTTNALMRSMAIKK